MRFNKRLLAPVAVLIAIILKDAFDISLTETEIEQGLNIFLEIGAGIWAAFTAPHKE